MGEVAASPKKGNENEVWRLSKCEVRCEPQLKFKRNNCMNFGWGNKGNANIPTWRAWLCGEEIIWEP
jgi:hypothetical protein